MNGFEFMMSKARHARFPVLAALLLVQFILIVGSAVQYWDLSWMVAAPAGLLYFFMIRKVGLNCLVAIAAAYFGWGMELPLVIATLFGLYALLQIISAVANSVQEFAV